MVCHGVQCVLVYNVEIVLVCMIYCVHFGFGLRAQRTIHEYTL